MQSSPGLCRNEQGCDLARSGQLIQIPLYDPFICPECGAALASPPLPAQPPRTAWHLALAALLLVALGAGAAAWWTAGDGHVTATLATATLRPAPPANSVLALASPPALTVAATDVPSAQVAAPEPAAPAPDGHFTPTPLAGGAPAYPAALAADGRSGSVRVACTIAPDGTPRGCTAKAAQGSKLFAPAVLAWLAQKPHFKPVTRHGHPVSERVHWRVAVTESASAARAAKRAASQPVNVRQPASLLAIGSTHPVFPDQYYESDWMGHVTVDCMIGTNGQATGCREKEREGSTRFADAVLTWLANPRTRFQPATSQGHAVPARRVWQVGFTP